MKHRKKYILLILSLVWFCDVQAQSTHQSKLWHKQPADASVSDNNNAWKDDPEWLKALPLGNDELRCLIQITR